MSYSACHTPPFFSGTLQTEILSTDTSDFLKQIIILQSINSVFNIISFLLPIPIEINFQRRDFASLGPTLSFQIDCIFYGLYRQWRLTDIHEK